MAQAPSSQGQTIPYQTASGSPSRLSAAVVLTKYVSEQDFNFKGLFNKVVGFLLQREFKQQTLRHMQGFKRFVEEAALKQGSLL
jgi:hypothetical protein